MDITTLAAAKAYTDKKVGAGGDIISLNEYGIDLISFLFGGGGEMEIESVGMFERVQEAHEAGKIPVFTVSYFNSLFYLNPLCVGTDDLAFKFAYAINGGLMEATVHMTGTYVNGISRSVTVTAFVETHTIS